MFITFGTSGHRGIIGQDFSLKHVQAIAMAVADLLLIHHKQPHVVIGYDPRRGNSPALEEDSFTKAALDVFLKRGLTVDFFNTYVPTPVVSWHIAKNKLHGGIILTASHNPPQYNGLKFNPTNGAPAPTEITSKLEELANRHFTNLGNISSMPKTGQWHRISPEQEFVKNLLKNCQKHLKITKNTIKNLNFVIDAKHGTVGQIWQEIFNQLNLKKSAVINQKPLSDFGNIEPNPTKYASLTILKTQQNCLSAQIAIESGFWLITADFFRLS